MQPYSAFNQGQLATILIENLLEQYFGGRMIKGIADASRARAEEAAREEVQRALAEFCATHDCTPR
jgi:acyl-CoA hydrolase